MQEAISFSFKPMQRLVKIELMVKGIRDKTPEGDEQWRLQSALGLIEDVCLYVNQIKCAIDDYTKQREAKIQVGFDVNFMSPSQRSLVIGGSLVSVEDEDKINVMTLLFNDCIVLLNEDDRRKKKEKRSSFMSRRSRAQQSRSKTKTRYTLFYKPLFLPFVQITDAGKNRFVVTDGLSGTEFELEAPSSAAKVEWMKLLKNVKEDFEASVSFCCLFVFLV